jgi:hypothetical protein
MRIKLKGVKGAFSVLDSKCIGCTCLQLGEYQSRGATLSGSRNTGDASQCCVRRAYHGCPDEVSRCYSKDLEAERKKQGARNS